MGFDAADLPTLERRSAEGQCIGPGFVDSHVHLSYLPEAEAMRSNGVVAAIDLASPLSALAERDAPLEVRRSGPMITALGGYPTRSWGSDGYGLEVASPAEAAAAVDRLIDGGAALIKVAVDGTPALSDEQLRSIVARAEARGVKVAAHALTEASAARAARTGCHLLAHTPVEPLSDTTVALWADRAVITTLRAFGGSADALTNLKRLRAAGTTVLYGTDFGNTRTAGIDPTELDLMKRAGFDPDAIRAAATLTPAAYWGFEGLGKVEIGARADLWIGPCDCAWCPAPVAADQ